MKEQAEHQLPIHEILPQIRSALREGRRLLISAPPGAGKTTEVPRALLAEPWCTGSVVITQPRRIAARLGATYVAARLAEPVGRSVGYRVRFDERVSAQTRLLFETEGLFLRRLVVGEDLAGVSAVVIDEIHERSQTVDCLLGLLLEKQRDLPNLRLVLMSATLDSQELGRALGNAPVLESQGRSFPVSVSHQDKPDERPLPIQIRSAIAGCPPTQGDILVFVPGAREIRQCQEALEGIDREVLALHGELPIDEQSRITGPRGERPRVILATNVAESSVTIPGVTTVIDTGLSRTARHDFLSGAVRLSTEEVSQARLIQRAGRAGRTGPGRCIRLFSLGSFQRRPAQDSPEILRSDLSELVLLLKRAGYEPAELPWPTPPEEAALRRSQEQLEELGALSAGQLTEVGKKMVDLPLPPRLARVVVEGQRANCLEQVCRVAALLAERDLKRRAFTDGRAPSVVLSESDLDDRLALLERAEAVRYSPRALRAEGIDPNAAQAITRLAGQLLRSCAKWSQPKEAKAPPSEKALLGCLLTGFYDRVAERRGAGDRLLFCSGAQAVLAPDSGVQGSRYLLALSAGGGAGIRGTAVRQSLPIVQLAMRVDPDDLLDLLPQRIDYVEEATYDRARDRVDQRSQMTYGKIVLSESVVKARPGPLRTEALLSEALARGEAVYDPDGKLESLSARLTLLGDHRRDLASGLPAGERNLLELAGSHEDLCRAALLLALESAESLRDLAQQDLAELLLHAEGPLLARVLEDQVPLRVKLPGGRDLTVVYRRGAPPHAASRLQDFFSMGETPRILGGSLALQLHLLAPNKRPIQVTTDLGSFWRTHYPELRRALMRRYPKHSWPEDGASAPPPAPGKLR